MCSSNNTGIVTVYTSDGYTFYHCKDCDGIFANPMKAGDKEWYETSEWYALPAGISLSLRWYEKVFLNKGILWKDKRVLNIGCGRNTFLKKLKDSGCHITAVDINEKIVEFNKGTLGIDDIYAEDIMTFIEKYKGGKFDTVIFFEVLEHLENPGEFIRGLKNIMKENGIIALSVPNRERILPSKDIWDYPPHHLTRWNIKSLGNFLETNGYLVDEIIISPLSAEDLLSLFRIFFGTKYLEDKINTGDKRLFVTLLFRVLFKLRVIFYNILAIIGRVFIKTKGLNLYAVARIENVI